jgi:hypothetical protein
MNPTREQAYGALFAQLQTIPEVVTCTRRLRHWSDVSTEEQPAVFLKIGGESRSNTDRRLPPRILLGAEVWVYVNTHEGEAGPVIHPLLDQIDDVLAVPLGADELTLGGTVARCWIEGSTQIFEGDLGSTAVAIVPVQMLLTSSEFAPNTANGGVTSSSDFEYLSQNIPAWAVTMTRSVAGDVQTMRYTKSGTEYTKTFNHDSAGNVTSIEIAGGHLLRPIVKTLNRDAGGNVTGWSYS